MENLNKLDVVGNMAGIASASPNIFHLKAFDLPPQEKMLVITTAGIVQLGEFLARGYLKNR